MYIDFSAFIVILNYYKYVADYINIKQFFSRNNSKDSIRIQCLAISMGKKNNAIFKRLN